MNQKPNRWIVGFACVTLANFSTESWAQGNPYGAPNPQVPQGTDSFGNSFEGPGPFPGKLTGAHVDITVEPGSVLGGDKSNNLLVEFPAMGPISWTDARHNEGDIAFNLSPNSSDALPPAEFGEWAVSDGPTTYAWTVDRRAGIALATVRANGFDNGDTTSEGQAVGKQYGVAYFTHGFRSGVGYSPIDGAYSSGNGSQDLIMGMIGEPDEASFNLSLAYFPYVEGWTGAQVAGTAPLERNTFDLDGEAIVNYEAGSVGYGVNTREIRWLDVDDDFEFNQGVAQIQLPGVEPDEDGMLFVAPANGSSNSKIAGAAPVDEYWFVTVRDDRETDPLGETFAPLGDSAFSFVYLPWDTEDLVGAYVEGDSGEAIESKGPISVSRSSEGVYTISIEGKTANDGMLILSNAGAMDLSDDSNALIDTVANPAFLSYEFNGDEMIVESNRWTDSGVEAMDTDFYVAWVDFENPMSPAELEAPRLWTTFPIGFDLIPEEDDPLTEIDDNEVDIAVNTDRPEILVTTIMAVGQDDSDTFDIIIDPITNDDSVRAVVGYFIDPFTGAVAMNPEFPEIPLVFNIAGNPEGGIETLDVEYNPISQEYVVITKADGVGMVEGLPPFGQPLIGRVNTLEKILAGEDPVVDARQIDDFETSYDDVSLAINPNTGDILIVAEQTSAEDQAAGAGEGFGAYMLDSELNPISGNVRLDTLEMDRDEDDPDVVFLPQAGVFVAITNIDPSTESNRITGTVIQPEVGSNGELVVGNQQILGEARLTGINQGHAALIENPFNGELILGLDYGNGNDGGDLAYLSLNENGVFSIARPQVSYLEASGGQPFNHRHPQFAADPNSEIIVLAHNLSGEATGMAFTVLDKDGQILPVEVDIFEGFHGFVPTSGAISNGANYNNIVYDAFSDSFFVAYNDDFEGTRVVKMKALTDPVIVDPEPDTGISRIAVDASGTLTIDYSGTLQSAESVDGPYSNVEGANGGQYSVVPTSDAIFFRVQ